MHPNHNAPLPPNLTHWLVVSPDKWGKGQTRDEAMRVIRSLGVRAKSTPLVVYRVSPEVTIDRYGSFVYTYWPDQEYQREVERINC